MPQQYDTSLIKKRTFKFTDGDTVTRGRLGKSVTGIKLPVSASRLSVLSPKVSGYDQESGNMPEKCTLLRSLQPKRGDKNRLILKCSSARKTIASQSKRTGIISNNTPAGISHSKKILCTMARSKSLFSARFAARRRFGAFWRRGVSAVGARLFTLNGTRVAVAPCTYWRGSQYVAYIPVAFFAYSWLCQQHQDLPPYANDMLGIALRRGPTSGREFLGENGPVSSRIALCIALTRPFRLAVNDREGGEGAALGTAPLVS